MLNSNFDLRTFLAESKNPTLSEGAKFKVGDMVKLSGGEPTEVLAVRKMTGSDLHAYSIKNSKGERAEYDENQLTAADVSEVLSEATVMEYIRERMTEMNNEVRSCMREYLQRCNEIDPGHEDAHAQLMGALEDFYNKLKAHFEADAMEDPMPGDEEPPVVLPSDAPSRELDGSPMYEGEEEDEAYGHEEPKDDELEESVNEGEWEDKGQDPELNKKRLEDLKAKRAKGGPKGALAMMDKEIAQLEKLVSEGPEEEKQMMYDPKDLAALRQRKRKETDIGDKVISNKGKEIKEEEALNEVDHDLLMGLGKAALNIGSVPALMALLYKLKNNKKIGQFITALEKFNDA